MPRTHYDTKVPVTVPAVGTLRLRYIATVEEPIQPDRPTVLFLHGHSSSVGELKDVFPLLEPHADVFVFDQPNNGDADDVKYATVTPHYQSPETKGYEAMFFLRDVVDAFVDTVVRPVIVGKTKGVIVAGGSLGGNLALLLAERVPTYSWLHAAAAWSPGSAWDASVEFALGAGVARERAKHDWSLPGEDEHFLRMMFCEPTVPNAVAAILGKKSYPQPWYWYWDCWGNHMAAACSKQGEGDCSDCRQQLVLGKATAPFCATTSYPGMSKKKVDAIAEAFDSVRKSFTAHRRQWHWQVAAEEVAFIHTEPITVGTIPMARCGLIGVPTLLMAGDQDRFWPADLLTATKNVHDEAKQWGAPVRWEKVADCGHSIHNERPDELTRLLLSLR
jgi:pimeloyl-ACP methyl ester carboxylesterase